jgi:hypothetical protein
MKKIVKLSLNELRLVIKSVIKEQSEFEGKKLQDVVNNLNVHKNLINPDMVDEIMEILNDRMGGFGIEALRGKENDKYLGDVIALYIDMGDTYARTVIYDTQEKEFHLKSWGDFMESRESSDVEGWGDEEEEEDPDIEGWQEYRHQSDAPNEYDI